MTNHPEKTFDEMLDDATHAVLAAFGLDPVYVPDFSDAVNTALETLAKPYFEETA